MKTNNLKCSIYITLFVITVIAIVVRINLLGLHRLHMDECLYSNYAMRMVDRGDLLLNGGLQVDKPPLFFYFVALSFLINGKSENAARIPNIIFSILTILFVFKLAAILYKDDSIAMLSAFFMAFSVMFVLFSVTAFQDISMLMFFVLALITAYERKLKLSGIIYACSVACKPMTLFLFPIYFYFIYVYCGIKPNKKNILNNVIGMFYVFIPLILWSVFAANPRFGIFKFFVTQQPEVMSVSFNVWERLNFWFLHCQNILNNYFYFIAAIVGALAGFVFSLMARKEEIKSDIFLLLSFLYTASLLTLVNFRIFDRYLLIFFPFIAIMLARTLAFATCFIKIPLIRYFIIIVLITPFFIYMHNLPERGPSIGALHTGTDGFEKVAEYLKDKQGDTFQIIYFGHTLSWYGYFYLYNTKFGDLKLTYNLQELDKAVKSFNKQSYVVLNARDRSNDELIWIKNKYKLILDVKDKDNTKEKFLIFLTDKKSNI